MAKQVIYQFPAISIGDGFWPQVLAEVDDLERVKRIFSDFREPFNESLRKVIIPSIRRNFEAEGRPPWEQLAEITVQIRRSAHPILRRTGYLFRKATQINIWRVSRDIMYSPIGPFASYAAFHQGGTRHMPARPYILYQREDVESIVDVFSDWIDRKLQQQGGA